MTISDDSRSPSAWMLLGEGASLLKHFYLLVGRLGERGPLHGPKVMVVPGFLGSDRFTLGLQRALAKAGYRATGWGMGFNLGACSDTLERLVSAIERFGKGEKVALMGWSLGGIFAREAAKLRPDLVAKVVTMGTPFSGSLRANNAWRLYEWVAGHPVDRPPIRVDIPVKPPVPTIALWSRRDGIVAARSARGHDGERDRQIELPCTHLGFALDPAAYPEMIAALAD